MCFRLAFPVFTIAILILGCSPRSDNKNHLFESSFIDGVLTVTNRGNPKYTEQLFRYEEVLRLKEDPGNDDSILFIPVSYVQNGEGKFYVVDFGRNRIAVFDRNGNFIRAIGRTGEGPGEFNRLSTIFVHQDVIQAYDSISNRLTRFNTDGTVIDVTSLNLIANEFRTSSLASLSRAFLTADNRLILVSQERERTGQLVHFGRKVIVLDSDREVEWQVVTPLHMFQTISKGIGILIPYTTMPTIQYNPSQGVLFSPGDEPTLLLYNIDGSIKLRINFELEAKPITANDRARVLDMFDERIADASERSAVNLRIMKEGTIFPDRWPYWESATFDTYGYMWLAIAEHDTDRLAAGGGSLYMVLSPEGEYLGISRRPTGGIYYGRILTRSTDEETGIVNLIVYQIHAAIEGFTYP